MKTRLFGAAALTAAAALAVVPSVANAEADPLPPDVAPVSDSTGTVLPPVMPKPVSPARQRQATMQLYQALLRADGSGDTDSGTTDSELPDPLDFDSFAKDPDDFMLPDAAQQFGEVGNMVIGRPRPGGTPAGKVPAGLEDFYGQKVKWGPCEPFGYEAAETDGFQCGYLIVPVDYSKPNGQTAAIGLLRKAAASGKSKGTLFMDPGGPGGSGMDIASWLSTQPQMADVAQDFDIVGFDPRGVGNSLPQIRCESAAEFDAQRAGSDKLNGDAMDKILKHNTDACYERTGVGFKGFDTPSYLNNIGTRNVVKDLDVMRSALGDAKLNYLGFSYGTSIGYQYAMAFKDNIRALVLDGVVNPFENAPEAGKEFEKYFPTQASQGSTSQISGFQATFEQFLKKCAADDGFVLRTRGEDGGVVERKVPCALGKPGDSVEQMQKKYQKLARAAFGTAHYKNSTDGRVVSFADITQGTIQAMYSDYLWPRLNAALALLDENQDGAGIQALADDYYDRSKNGTYGFANAAFKTISCVDDHTDYSDRDAAVEEAKRWYRAAPFIDPGVDEAGKQRGAEPSYGWCHYYRNRADIPPGKVIKDAPNVLVLSTTYDSATPYPNGVVAADALDGTLLTVAGSSHTSYARVPCATQIVNNYILNLEVPADGAESGEESQTKDIYSKVIDGHQCRINSFRPRTANPNPEETEGSGGTDPTNPGNTDNTGTDSSGEGDGGNQDGATDTGNTDGGTGNTGTDGTSTDGTTTDPADGDGTGNTGGTDKPDNTGDTGTDKPSGDKPTDGTGTGSSTAGTEGAEGTDGNAGKATPNPNGATEGVNISPKGDPITSVASQEANKGGSKVAGQKGEKKDKQGQPAVKANTLPRTGVGSALALLLTIGLAGAGTAVAFSRRQGQAVRERS